MISGRYAAFINGFDTLHSFFRVTCGVSGCYDLRQSFDSSMMSHGGGSSASACYGQWKGVFSRFWAG
jgi:hypothetical protein